MEVAAIAARMGEVDASFEHRSSLVAALRAKLGMPDPAANGAPLQGFDAKMEQVDRDFDARQRLLDALKAQLSKSAALPKSAPSYPPMQPQWDPSSGAAGCAAGCGLATSQPPAWQGLPAGPLQPLPADTSVSGFATMQPMPVPLSGPGAMQFSTSTGPAPQLLPMGDPAVPQAKRLRLGEDFAGWQPAGPAPLLPAPNGVVIDGSSGGQNMATSMFATQDPGNAELAALAARKAAMLRNLQAAENPDSQSQPAADSLQNGAAFGYASGPGAGAPATAPGAVPQLPPGVPPPPQAPGARPESPAGPDAVCPPGVSPEQFEAYRQQCWRQYYEYCAVWQKYYTQQQAGARPAQPPPGKAAGKGIVAPPAPPASGRPVMPPPRIPPVPPPASSAAGSGAAGQGRGLMEEDIHSKLLGL